MTFVRTGLRAARRPAGLSLIVLTLGMLALAVRDMRAELSTPTASDRQVAVAVASLMNREHLLRHPLNAEMSHRWINMYLKSLDPMKLYFLQADIDHFKEQQDVLGDRLQRGDINFAYEVYKVYMQRLNERVAVIDELIKMQHDFTVDESLNVDFDKRPYAKTQEELRERWRQRIKYDLLLMKAAKTEAAEAREKLTKRYHSFAKNMKQFSHDDLLEIYLTSLTTTYDPHTTYMSASTLENFQIQMRGELEGIGAALQLEDGSTVVSKIIQGGAADKDKRLKVKDVIIGVGQGSDGPIVDVVDMRLNDVVQLVRGPKNTIVRLQVLPKGVGKPVIYNVARASIELKDSLARSEIVTAGKRPDGQPYKVGVIDLPSFYMDMEGARLGKVEFRSTTRDVKRLLDEFHAKGVDAVVIDLRRNGGGALQEAIALTGLFIDEGPVVQVKDADGRVQHYDDLDSGTAWDGPLVVLTSKFSASASEIFAGALQDYHRALILGDHQTHGKGTVQSMLDLGRQLFRAGDAAPKWGALKITMQQFYRPNGDSTQNRGVVADVELPSLTTHLDVGEKDLEYALKFDQVKPAPFKEVNSLDKTMIGELSSKSKQRCDAADDFKKVAKRIERYRQQKEKKLVTLNEKKFMAERSEMNAEEEAEKEIEKQEAGDRPVVDRNYYFNEVLNVTVDYAQMLSKAKLAQGR